MTHKSEDYKISAVKYYLKNKDNIRKTCKIFELYFFYNFKCGFYYLFSSKTLNLHGLLIGVLDLRKAYLN